MEQSSIFFDEWLSSLRAQYQHVVRADDKVTLPSLTAVMQKVGFGEDELRRLRLAATLHVDDAPDGFVPDLKILAEPSPTAAHPAECLCPDCAPIDESRFDADGQPLPLDPEATGRKTTSRYAAAPAEPDEAEPVTFADSLDPQSTVSEAPEPRRDDDEAGSFANPDAPQQSNLF
ncbi:MAG: hypothetical protein OXE95_03035 [Chloroflexi bacterium]|nr:hypothetical protein [Chloroflexota bacterium]MCY4246538.1 hypothetical protein [Chloroflexota bacterium]